MHISCHQNNADLPAAAKTPACREYHAENTSVISAYTQISYQSSLHAQHAAIHLQCQAARMYIPCLLRELDREGGAGCRLLLRESAAGSTAARSAAGARPHIAGSASARGGIGAGGRIGARAAGAAIRVKRIHVVGSAVAMGSASPDHYGH